MKKVRLKGINLHVGPGESVTIIGSIGRRQIDMLNEG
jgi:predicted ABC-type transport system involved in lysophospholipase L1 biosynthesis ATPase subunit